MEEKIQPSFFALITRFFLCDCRSRLGLLFPEQLSSKLVGLPGLRRGLRRAW
jgi:hypothetical protein